MNRHHFRPTLETLEGREVPAVLPNGFTEFTVASGINSPTTMALAPDGRIFVAEQTGDLRVITANGTLLTEPFVSLNVDPQGERGLLGVAFDPNFASNGFVYVYYTVPQGSGDPTHNRLSRFTASGNTAVPGSEVVLFQLNPLTGATNHNGGALHFGLDGKLYIAVGDNATPSNSQTLENLLGKMLRINPDGTIPNDNPFFGVASGDNRAIWTLGLRNPFSFAVQPGTGRIFINDVGGSAWEEINEGIAGANYGWPDTEGPTNDPRFVSPLFAYPHDPANNQRFAITGGTFYNPTTNQFGDEFTGDYFYADFVAGFIRRLDLSSGSVVDRPFATGVSFPVDLKTGTDGSLYYLERGTGSVVRIVTTSATPTIDVPPSNQLVSVGQDATFQVSASGTGTLSYQWTRNGVTIPGATNPTLVVPNAQLADNGATFRVRVSNQLGMVESGPANLEVTTDLPPTATITSPGPNDRFVAGETYTFSGFGDDPETGPLPPSAFEWRVDYVTGGVVRPFVPTTTGVTSGTFTPPQRTPFTETDVLYRVVLTVTDPRGLRTTVTRDFLPEIVPVTIQGNGSVSIDGGPIRPLPLTFESVAGVFRLVTPAPSVIENGRRLTFQYWEDGGPRVREIVGGAGVFHFSAVYRQAAPLVVGAGVGGSSVVTAVQVDIDDSLSVEAFPGSTNGARVTTGDFNGDGIPDLVVGAGPGDPPRVRIFDGVTGTLIADFFAFEPSFTGGVFVTAIDLNRDGFDELIISPDEGGGPRVRILNGSDLSVIRDFFAIEDPNFRGGVRTAFSDLNGDGVPDLLVAAGFGGGPRVAVFDGARLFDEPLEQLPAKLFGDFFVFEASLRNGVFLAGGDMNGDGVGDLVAGAGPGGGPRVLILDGRDLVQSGGETRTALANFFAGDVSNRGGVRVVTKDLNGDAFADLVVAPGVGAAPLVKRYSGQALTIEGNDQPVDQQMVFDPGFTGGVFVG